MQKKARSLLSEIFFILVCLFGSAFSIYNFYRSFTETLTKNETPIATISFKYKTAQRKFNDNLIWDHLRQDAPVYEGDTIRTASLAEATIYFNDGNIMDLQENTMARISLKEDGAEAEFLKGEISVRTSEKSGFKIKSGSNIVQVASKSDFEAGNNTEGNFEISVKSGNATLSNDTGVLELQQGKTVEINTQGEASYKSLSVIYPLENMKILNFMQDKIPVTFNWKSEVDTVKIEISSTRNFKNIEYANTYSNTDQAEIALTSGIHYWRIYGVSDTDKTEEASGKLNVLYSPTPKLISPVMDYSVSYRTKTPSIRFSWTESERATSYEFKIADNPEMKDPVINQRYSSTSSIVASLEEGTWYWNVTPYYVMNSVGLAHPSETYSFTITKNTVLNEPELLYPEDESFVCTKIPMEDKSYTYKKILFSWKADKEASNFEFKLWSQNSQNTNLVQQRVSNNYYSVDTSVTDIPDGLVFWQVTIFDKEGNYKESKTYQFYAMDSDLEQKTIFPPDGYRVMSARSQDLRYNWKTNVPYETKFELASDKNFKDIIYTENTKNTSVNGRNLSEGRYYWRITSTIGKLNISTPAKTLVVEPPLAKPEVIIPENNGRAVIRANIPFEMKWQPVEEADYYQVQVFKADNRENVIYEKNFIEPGKDNSLSTAVNFDPFEEGMYGWTIQAFREETSLISRASSYIGEYSFRMKKLKPVKLAKPANRAVIEGVDAFKTPGIFEWTTVDDTSFSELILYKDSVTENNRVVTYRNAKTTEQMPRLYEGNYFWRVKAITEDDLDISSEEVYSFSITAIPKLKSPVMIEPVRGKVFDANYFMENRQIRFKWGTVAQAAKYIFTVQNEEGEYIINEELPSDQTEYIYENIASLKVGKLTWTVEALSEFEGLVFQHGETNPIEFSISLPTLNKPKMKEKKGKRYGR